MIKKIMAFLVLLTLCLGAMSCATSGIQYTLSADGTYYIATGYESSNKELTSLRIPDEYKGLPVRAVDNGIGWLQVVSDVTKISLPEGLICLDTFFANTAYYEDEDNWEEISEDGVTYKALYLDDYLLDVQIVSGEKDGFHSFTVKDGTKGIVSGAFFDASYHLTLPASLDFIGSGIGLDKITIQKRCQLFDHGDNQRITYLSSTEQWKALTADVEEYRGAMTFYEDPAYNADELLENGYNVWVVHCTDGTCVYN